MGLWTAVSLSSALVVLGLNAFMVYVPMNSCHRHDTGDLMEIAIELRTESVYDTVPDHDTHPCACNTGGLVHQNSMSR